MGYLDVSTDPDARERSGVSDASIDRLVEAGIEPLGWAAFVTPDKSWAQVTWVGRTGDRRAIVSLSFWDGREVIDVRTLAEDGRIAATQTRPRWTTWMRVRWGIRPPERHGFVLLYATGDLASLLAQQTARAKEHGLVPIGEHDMAAYLATRIRFGEISRPRWEHAARTAARVERMTFVTLSAAAVAASIAERDTLGVWAIVAGLAGVLVAHMARDVAREVGRDWVGPLLARGLDAPARRPADTQLEEARAAGDRGADALLRTIPMPVRLPASRIDRARRIDAAITIVHGVSLPALGLAISHRAGMLGWVVAAATLCLLVGTSELVSGRAPDDALRARLLPELAAAQARASVKPSAPMPRMMGLLMMLFGGGALAWARSVEAAPPSPHWLTAGWGVLAFSFVVNDLVAARQRHERILPER